MPNSHCFAITNIAWLFIADKFTSSKSSSWVVHYFSSLIQLVHLASKTLSWFSSYFTIPPPQSLSLISPLLLDFLMLEWPSTVLFPLPFPTYTFQFLHSVPLVISFKPMALKIIYILTPRFISPSQTSFLNSRLLYPTCSSTILLRRLVDISN